MERPEYASYAYAVCRPFDAGTLEGLAGVGGHPVHLVSGGELAVAVSTVPLDEFDERELRAKLEDLRWLEGIARAHHGVVEAVARRSVAVPLRLATVYRGDDRVREVLREHGEVFGATLRELSGRVEMGVKVYADTDTSPRGTGPCGEPPSGESPGRSYLRRRRQQREVRDDVWQRAARLCERTDEVLGELARARERHQPQSAALAGVSGENVMNTAYLVDEEEVEAFIAAARELGSRTEEGVRVEVSGPWVPYSFASPSPSEVSA